MFIIVDEDESGVDFYPDTDEDTLAAEDLLDAAEYLRVREIVVIEGETATDSMALAGFMVLARRFSTLPLAVQLRAIMEELNMQRIHRELY